MNITLTRKEFRRLVELVYMGENVVLEAGDNAGAGGGRYGELVQKIYKLAAQKGACPNYVEADEEVEDFYHPSMDLEADSPAATTLEQYENAIFWDELISRLAERDAEREQLRNPSLVPENPDEALERQLTREGQLEKRYRAEFVKNDLGNLFVMFGSDRLS
ncbi:hypothetical protein M2103_000758 [Ereboglobus sp. PH5-5]|uniref:hypothetical protein n=1 Tax=unclassified Ereboglobus TaxID=2626932 RepID=UPI002404A88F|nr:MULTISPECIES: hypothetical protein [unclassified Ereboglobus]MDF9827127.1 hypothetical protein [Ereboglobus sp. PH5-10]MDF9832548.1 hypothetical protein [Ereboglobus sp. PH5-5]